MSTSGMGHELSIHHPGQNSNLATALPPATDPPSDSSPNGAVCHQQTLGNQPSVTLFSQDFCGCVLRVSAYCRNVLFVRSCAGTSSATQPIRLGRSEDASAGKMQIMQKSCASIQPIIALTLILSASVVTALTGSALAQQTTGTPGSPDATTTIDGKYLPPPAPPFGGTINLDSKDSKPFWPASVVPPKGAPNVLLIMTDDQGYGVSGTFGGVIPTPALDRIAKAGLRYTQFHSTALCSPTRAALITGRNHHSVGFGVITEMATGFPGYDSVITASEGTVGRILKDNGYATSWFGKDHNVPAFQASQAGPFDRWPIGMGFDYFYGFVGGDTSQWQPNLFRQTTQIYPYVGHPGWNLTTAMADDAIAHIKMLNDLDPDKPFFVYYVPGGIHAPHHPTPAWIKKISDMHLFDKGWNALRDQIVANQKQLGVIPQDATLTPWPDDLLKKWDTLSADEKKLFIRQADVYAA